MITIIPCGRTQEHPEIFGAVYALRHRVFVDEMEWKDLASLDDREVDQFDDEHTVHLIFEFEANWILRALQLQFLVQLLGRLHQVGKQSVVAAKLSITSTTLFAIRDKRERYSPVIRGLEPVKLAS